MNIRTREFPARRQINYTTSVGANNLVRGQTLPFAPRAGGEPFGMASSSRRIPDAISQANFMSNIPQSVY